VIGQRSFVPHGCWRGAQPCQPALAVGWPWIPRHRIFGLNTRRPPPSLGSYAPPCGHLDARPKDGSQLPVVKKTAATKTRNSPRADLRRPLTQGVIRAVSVVRPPVSSQTHHRQPRLLQVRRLTPPLWAGACAGPSRMGMVFERVDSCSRRTVPARRPSRPVPSTPARRTVVAEDVHLSRPAPRGFNRRATVSRR